MKVKDGQSNTLVHRATEPLPCELLKKCVATVLKPNALDVAGVIRHDSLVLFAIDLGSQASLEEFCKSLHNGIIL